jgi:DNA damage-inducible protein 1
MDLKALIEAEMSIPSINQALIYNGKELSDDSITIQDCGIVNDDMIFVNLSASELARQQILNNPQLRSQFHQNNPELERALNDQELFKRVYTEMQKHAREVQNRNNLNFSDPFDVEAQKQIEAEIRKENIARNYENAIEHNPEFFGRVIMLYIKVEVNGIPVKAFVDSGAQVTIMSPECAEKCRLMQILDHRFSGVATGVGTAKIIGRIHSTIFKIGKQFLPVSLSVMEGKDVDLLLGLDVLKRHQVQIH